jgi:ABC-type siderophore export system fused ATPase/permease subunit
MRTMLIGLNVDIVGCRNDSHISYGGSIYAYGGPILYLCIQVCFYLWLLLWLEGVHVFPAYLLNFRRKNTKHAHFHTSEEVEDEKTRVEKVESDLLRVLHVTKSFGMNVAVEDVSFGVSQGEILALLGPNGAGKSTIVNMIRGQLVPDKGMILLRGMDIVRNMRPTQKYLGGKFSSSIVASTVLPFSGTDHLLFLLITD